MAAPPAGSSKGPTAHLAANTPLDPQLWTKTLAAVQQLPATQDTHAHLRLKSLLEEGLSVEAGRGVRDSVLQRLEAEEAALDRQIACDSPTLCDVLQAEMVEADPKISTLRLASVDRACDSALVTLSALLSFGQPPRRSSSPMTPVDSTSVSALVDFPNHHGPRKAPTAHLPSQLRPDSSSQDAGQAALAAASPTWTPIPSFHIQPLDRRKTKQIKAELNGQLPLTPGRRVAFRLLQKTAERATRTGGKRAQTTATTVNDEWILAVVRRQIGSDVSKYDVVDADPDTGIETICRSNTLKRLIPLPTIGASIDSPAHISRFAPFANDSLALAIFPGTTAFYRCVVVGRESDHPSYHDASGSGSKRRAVSRKVPEMEQRYLVRFDDDEDRIRPIEVSDIAEWPGGQHDV